MNRWTAAVIFVLGVACRDELPPSIPSSQPSSMPAQHRTSTTAVPLSELFRMPETDAIAVRLGDRTVNRERLERRLRRVQLQIEAIGVPQSIERREILQTIVDQLLDELALEHVAGALGATADPQQIETYVRDLETRMEKEPAFRAFLAQAGNTPEYRHEDARLSALTTAVLDKLTLRLKAETATAARAYYERHKDDYTDHGGREVWRIVIKAAPIGKDRELAKLRADDVVKRAKEKRADFATLAHNYSEGGKATEGGYLGFVARGTFTVLLESQIWAAKPGAILGPVEEGVGFSIYKVGASREPRVLPFEEVEEGIFQRVRMPLLEKTYKAELERVKKQNAITIGIRELRAP